MKNEEKTSYTPPVIETVELRNEQGFAQSNPAYEDGGEFSW
ncbi:MAG: hypothetical protein PHV95_11850 [Eubacteriales bacterium]|nr:hypothetical protein [Eubacteriales bacterium]